VHHDQSLPEGAASDEPKFAGVKVTSSIDITVLDLISPSLGVRTKPVKLVALLIPQTTTLFPRTHEVDATKAGVATKTLAYGRAPAMPILI